MATREFATFCGDIEPIIIDGEEIGLVAMRGREIHMQIEKRYALRHARRIIRQYVAPQLSTFGYLTTVSTGEAETLEFLERLGFYKVGGFGSISMHRIDALKIK